MMSVSTSGLPPSPLAPPPPSSFPAAISAVWRICWIPPHYVAIPQHSR